MGERWLCLYRRHGFTNCRCARFDDGSCVPAHIYPEFCARRDAEAEAQTRRFADRGAYDA